MALTIDRIVGNEYYNTTRTLVNARRTSKCIRCTCTYLYVINRYTGTGNRRGAAGRVCHYHVTTSHHINFGDRDILSSLRGSAGSWLRDGVAMFRLGVSAGVLHVSWPCKTHQHDLHAHG